METAAYLINELVKKAQKRGEYEIIEKLKSPEFYGVITEVAQILSRIGIEVIDRNDATEFDMQKEINLKISRALAQNYQTMYYINLNTNEYIGYSSSDDYKSLKIEEHGKDFFKDCLRNTEKLIYKDDLKMVQDALTKENLINETGYGKTFNLVYRLMINGEPRYTSLKALKMAELDENLIIGITDIDEEKKAEIAIQQNIAEATTYSNIALALARNYFVVYYVNSKTNAYIEYSLDGKNQLLNIESSGNDFFNESKKNALIYIAPSDRKKFLDALEKDTILAEIATGEPYSLTYQQLFDGKPVYVQLTAMNLINDEDHIIFAVRSIDAQKRREAEIQKELDDEKQLARTDALTGVSNKYSYTESEKVLNSLIKNKSISNFAIVVCDINDLKKINDTYGHEAGDRAIKDAVSIIKKAFKNSNVYRVGGDEFAIIVRDSDYYKLDFIYEQIYQNNLKNMKEKKVIVSCGYSEFNPKVDKKVINVFVRADENMYANKRELKRLYKF